MNQIERKKEILKAYKKIFDERIKPYWDALNKLIDEGVSNEDLQEEIDAKYNREWIEYYCLTIKKNKEKDPRKKERLEIRVGVFNQILHTIHSYEM